MKTLICFTVILLYSQYYLAQDLLKLKGGEAVQVNIISTSGKEVRFTYWDDVDKTLQKVPKKQVSSIRYSPEKVTFKKNHIALTIGLPMFGADFKLRRILNDNRFNQTRSGFFGPIDYPRSIVFPAFMLEAEHLLRPNQGIGLAWSISNSGLVEGYKKNIAILMISHRDMAFHAYYALYDRWHRLQIRIGPSVHINQVYRNFSQHDQERHGKVVVRKDHINPGVYMGGSVALFEKEFSSLRFIVEYFYTPGKVSFGPFEEEIFTKLTTILDEQQVGLSHGLVGMRYSRKF